MPLGENPTAEELPEDWHPSQSASWEMHQLLRGRKAAQMDLDGGSSGSWPKPEHPDFQEPSVLGFDDPIVAERMGFPPRS